MSQMIDKFYILDFDTKVIINPEDKRQWGALDTIYIKDDKGVQNFSGIATMLSYLVEHYYGKLILLVVTDLDVFFSFLYSQLLKDFTLAEPNAKGRVDIYKKSDDMTYKYTAGGETYNVKFKMNGTVFLLENGHELTGHKFLSLDDLYDYVIRCENNPRTKGLFFKPSGASSLQRFSVYNFIDQGNSEKKYNEMNWFKKHPNLSIESPEVYNIFKQQQKPESLSKSYTAARRAVKGYYDKVVKFDCNNMYPSILCSRKFPIGNASITEGFKPQHLEDETRYLHVRMYNGYRSCVEDYDVTAEPVDITTWMWSFEFKELLRIHPEIRYKVTESIYFRCETIDSIRQQYLRDNYKEYKETGNKQLKLLNNTIYGKFSQREITISKKPFVNELDEIRWKETTLDKPIVPATQYYPLGSCIVAYGRVMISQTLRTGVLLPEDVVYIDTDSFVLIKNERTSKFLESGLAVSQDFGEWKEELDGDFSVFGDKAYCGESTDGKTIVEANAGGGKFSEAAYFNRETGEAKTIVKAKKHFAGGDVRVPVLKCKKEVKE